MDLSGLLRLKAKIISIIMWAIHLLLFLVGVLLTTIAFVCEPVLKVLSDVGKPITSCYKMPALNLWNKVERFFGEMEASWARGCKSKMWDRLSLRNGHLPCSYNRQMPVCIVLVGNIDEMDDGGSRLASFSQILTSFQDAGVNVHNLSAAKLAQQGYFYIDGCIQCCFCMKRIHIDDVLLRNQQEHNQYCRTVNEPLGQDSRYDELWDKEK